MDGSKGDPAFMKKKEKYFKVKWLFWKPNADEYNGLNFFFCLFLVFLFSSLFKNIYHLILTWKTWALFCHHPLYHSYIWLLIFTMWAKRLTHLPSFFSCLHTQTHTHTQFSESFTWTICFRFLLLIVFFPNCCFYIFFLLTHFDFPLFLHLLTFTFNCSIHWLFLLALKSSAKKMQMKVCIQVKYLMRSVLICNQFSFLPIPRRS